MRIILVMFFAMLSLAAEAQSDYLMLKKKGKLLKLYYSGSNIAFVSTTGAYRNALINKIKNDSIFLQEFLINQIPTTLGFYVTDTVGSFRFAYNYKQIASFGRENKKFNIGGSGAALLGGGTLLTLASGVVYVADRKNFSPALLAAAAGLATVGYVIGKTSGKAIRVGKNNYTLQYINMQQASK